MVYKTCSINKVLADFYRDFKPSHSGWVQDAVEWIGNAIDIMRVGSGYTEQSCEVEICDYRGVLPCELEVLLGIAYKGKRLQRNGSFNQKNLKHAKVMLMDCDHDNTYTLNPNYINTNFHSGKVTVFYLGIERDCDGYPVILDDAIYREALTWYILMKMIGRGFKHQVFDYKSAMTMWESTYPKAINRAKMFDLDGYRLFRRVWNGMTAGSNDFSKTFYNSSEFKQQKVLSNTYYHTKNSINNFIIKSLEDLKKLREHCGDDEFEEDYVGNYNYIGIAPRGTLHNEPVWIIYRVEFMTDGSTVILKAEGVKWDDRYTVIYI